MLLWLRLKVKFYQGLALHRQGRLAEAERIYEEILGVDRITLMRCICAD